VREVTQRKLQECYKLREEELAEEKRKKDEARYLVIQGMMRTNKMKATFREEVKQLSEDYMELYVDTVCETRANYIAKS
jgi:hypothetical protein